MFNLKANVRQPIVAGTFYPDTFDELKNTLASLDSQSSAIPEYNKLHAIIAPHAGFMYSGDIAAKAFRILNHKRFSCVVLLGPSHQYYLECVAGSTFTAYKTPLGEVAIDTELQNKLQFLQLTEAIDDAHLNEHSLEVIVPFLQYYLTDFKILPLVVGSVDPEIVRQIIQSANESQDVLIVVSSDMSHYLEYKAGKNFDRQTSFLIERKEYKALSGERACGHYPLAGLLKYAEQNQLNVTTVSLGSSGDYCNDKQRVVGYGAFHCFK